MKHGIAAVALSASSVVKKSSFGFFRTSRAIYLFVHVTVKYAKDFIILRNALFPKSNIYIYISGRYGKRRVDRPHHEFSKRASSGRSQAQESGFRGSEGAEKGTGEAMQETGGKEMVSYLVSAGNIGLVCFRDHSTLVIRIQPTDNAAKVSR